MDGNAVTGAAERLLSAWRDLKTRKPELRARDAAAQLGVSEGELALVRCDGANLRHLKGKGAALAPLIEGLKDVGRVMALTRNTSCVHETYGTVESVEIWNEMGQVVGPIDLRLFLSKWRVAVAVIEEVKSGRRHSIQVFDSYGHSVIKVYAVEETNWSAWEALIAASLDPAPEPVVFDPAPEPAAASDAAAVDLKALHEGWRALDHSHDFYKLLRTSGATRLQALELAEPEFVTALSRDAIDRALQAAAAERVPIMAFVSNPGCVQIYSGPVSNIQRMGPWLNVMDPTFHMHLRTDAIASGWRVVKPTRLRGDITSIELFDAQGEMILQAFGARPPGEPENPAWRSLVDVLPILDQS